MQPQLVGQRRSDRAAESIGDARRRRCRDASAPLCRSGDVVPRMLRAAVDSGGDRRRLDARLDLGGAHGVSRVRLESPGRPSSRRAGSTMPDGRSAAGSIEAGAAGAAPTLHRARHDLATRAMLTARETASSMLSMVETARHRGRDGCRRRRPSRRRRPRARDLSPTAVGSVRQSTARSGRRRPRIRSPSAMVDRTASSSARPCTSDRPDDGAGRDRCGPPWLVRAAESVVAMARRSVIDAVDGIAALALGHAVEASPSRSRTRCGRWPRPDHASIRRPLDGAPQRVRRAGADARLRRSRAVVTDPARLTSQPPSTPIDDDRAPSEPAHRPTGGARPIATASERRPDAHRGRDEAGCAAGSTRGERRPATELAGRLRQAACYTPRPHGDDREE